MSGQVAWGRLARRAPEALESTQAKAQTTRATPIALFPRDERDLLLHAARVGSPGPEAEPAKLRAPAEKILAALRSRGALFAGELETATRLLPVQVEEGLRALVANGLVACDGFAPLRRLLTGARRGSRRRTGRARLVPRGVAAPDGRWGLLEPLGDAPDPDDLAEATALRLLDRYGVVFRDLVARESLPGGWRSAHRALRRLEARGVVRGGRFVTGFIGEQFALPEAVAELRKHRNAEPTGREIRISAADPLNLVGILTPGPRIPAGHTRWIVFCDGLPVAVIERGRRRELTPADAETSPLTSRRPR